jgi:hypothetical protein
MLGTQPVRVIEMSVQKRTIPRTINCWYQDCQAACRA